MEIVTLGQIVAVLIFVCLSIGFGMLNIVMLLIAIISRKLVELKIWVEVLGIIALALYAVTVIILLNNPLLGVYSIVTNCILVGCMVAVINLCLYRSFRKRVAKITNKRRGK